LLQLAALLRLESSARLGALTDELVLALLVPIDAFAEAAESALDHERGLKLGSIADAFDARIQGIVSNWPVSVDGARAVALGLPQPPALKVIVEQYLEDFGPK
jgi:hypothetical protein